MAHVGRLADGRLHLHEGPIDLVIYAEGSAAAVADAEAAAIGAFDGLLARLVEELATLRRRSPSDLEPTVHGPVARRMMAATSAWARWHADLFVTPMAAVAGSVADHVLFTMADAADLDRAYVNDGGDIAVHLTNGTALSVGMVSNLETGAVTGQINLDHESPVRGVATSGRGGRSWSLGIADAVTVLAESAAQADVAATLIANAVDLDGRHPSITRSPACEEDPDSDLGNRLVTLDVGDLSPLEVASALEKGRLLAVRARQAGLLVAAALFLDGESRTVGAVPTLPKQGT